MIELIVTIAVSAILLSASVAGIVAWVHHSDFVRNENYAETIYYAAQAELTRYRGNGQLAELNMLVRSADAGDADVMGKVPVNDITDDYKMSLTSAEDVAKYNEDYRDRLYYLKKDAGVVDENNPLGGLLSDYIYDGSIMEGVICVEFDPSDGTVHSVTYSDKNTAFTYSDTAEEREFSLLDRTRNARKKSRVGYYSTELSESAPTAAGKTKVDEVQLVNEEQLYLKWSLPAQFDGIRKFLFYTIDIYDKANDTVPAYTFVLRGKDLKETDASLNIKSGPKEIDQGYFIKVSGEKPTGAGGKEKISHRFIAYNFGREMYLVLDSIDYGANPEKITKSGTESFNADALKNSASILPLFPEPTDIYIKIQAQGKPYKTSAWKQSNTSNTLFADMEKETNKNVYEIKNARHLYNIRYREMENSRTNPLTEDTCYRQTGDVVWPVDENRLFHSVEEGTGMKAAPLQDGDKCTPFGKTEKVPYFPAIPELGASSVLEAESGRNYELEGFVLFQDGGISEASETEPPKDRLGLIGMNEGTIRGLTFTGVTVQGTKNVGAVCGINKGSGKILDTAVSGNVRGKENVGGLVGFDEAMSGEEYASDPTEDQLKQDSAYVNLTNYAEVTADDGKAGGIIGILNEKGQAYRCENYGAVKGTETGTVYIGGITGYNKGLVQRCVSAPGDMPPGKMEDGELEEAALKGIFVGGIVGCNDGGTVRDSNTAEKTKDMAGKGGDAYIIGYRYVGGIVGYNNSAVEGEKKGTLINKQNCANKANVIGHDYVGGIVGANGLLKGSSIAEKITPEIRAEYAACEIDEVYSPKMIVEDWVNEGLVEAVGSVNHAGDYEVDGHYAGGIAGYNAGDLQNCTTRINTSSGGSNLIDQVRLYGKNASYVGGVAGYNVGYIYRGDDGTTSVNSVVSGKKYVGGIVGYNGTAKSAEEGGDLVNSGRIKNYALTGGNISAESYAGGYVGLNTTEKLLSGTDGKPYMLRANPNEVTADYMAGGVMGALILVPEGDIRVNCATNNFFGKVTAKYAFAGGYAGYTQVLPKGTDIEQRAEALHGKLINAAGKATEQKEKLQNLAEAVLDERLTPADGTFELQFTYDDQAGENQFASIEAPIFAGGVIGCNSWNTKLLLQKIYNKVQVTATGSVTYDFISKAWNEKEGAQKQDNFSFAGGIIGLVTPYATIASCGNSGAGGVQGVGTYEGGIAEVNLGTIMECEAVTVSNKNYYGGIVGLNTNGGTVEKCSLRGQISGGSYLGGIAACNESIIKDCTVKSRTEGESAVLGTGQYVGGIAAVNRIKNKPEDKGVYSNQIDGCKVDANIGVPSMGEFVGGLFGSYQGGDLVNTEISADKTIYGIDCVGGIAGEIRADLKGTEESRIANSAAVNAENAAGGIGGMLVDGVTVEWCENSGMVRSMSGLAGGIVPQVSAGSTVKACRNKGNIESVTNIAGGIVAENHGDISYVVKDSLKKGCSVESDSVEITIKGTDSVGGIAGKNMGTISTCEIKGHVSVSDINGRETGRAIGGIAGRNQGKITEAGASSMKTAEGREWWPKVTTLSQGSYLGGVAGTNVSDGTTDSGKIIDGRTLEIDVTMTQRGTVGGVAGANAGTITNMSFSGTVMGTSGSQYGTGGIAGRNELTEANKTGTISNCSLSRGTVSAASGDTGFGGHTDSAKGAYVGGICGVNPENGTISGCSLKGGSSVSANYGYVGGIAAYNLGELTENKSTQAQTANIFNSGNTAGRCVIGGIAAYNGASGVLKNCETGGWTITNDMDVEVEVYPTGGIIGCNKSIHDQIGLVNYADVAGNWMTGGVIGQQITEQRGGFTIERCENHGEITAKYRSAGGIISDWRNQSGRVRECINYGEVSIEYGDRNAYNHRNAAGGIIGTGWWGTPVTIFIERCGNEGKISHDTEDSKKYGKAAGIFGAYNAASAKLTLSITDCYNAAEIQNEDEEKNNIGEDKYVSAGIFAGDENGGTMDVTITRCVNYGKGTNLNKGFGGIVSKRYEINNKDYYFNGSFSIKDCLSAGEGKGTNMWPAHSGISEGPNNYFIKNPSDAVWINPSSRTVAEHQWNDTFSASGGASFDPANMRLILPADSGDTRGRYLQFSAVGNNVKYDDSTTGDAKQAEIRKLKDAFSAYGYRKDKGVNDKYAMLVYGITKGTFNPPGNVELKEEDGVYTVTFEPDADTLFCTAGYEVEIVGERRDDRSEEIIKSGTGMEINDPSKNSFTIAESNLFDQTHPRTNYIRLKARVRAKKVDSTDYEDIVAPMDGRYSNWAESPWLSSNPKLPTPVFHFEVTAEGNNKNDNMVSGYWVLDNAEVYNKLCGAGNWKVELGGITDVEVLDSNNTRAGAASGSGEWQYASDKGQGSAATENVQAQAIPLNNQADSFEQSDPAEKMLNLYRKSSTLRADAVGSGEFIGTTTDDLKYRFSLKQSGGNYGYVNITYMAELWLGNEKLGESAVALPMQSKEADCTIAMEKKADETEKAYQEKIRRLINSVNQNNSADVKVCFYPWEIEDVKYYVTDDTTKRTVPTAANASAGVAGNTGAFNSSYQTIYVNNLTDYKMYPAPEPGATLNPDITADGVISYTLYWDMDMENGTLTEKTGINSETGTSYDGAEYAVTVTGKNGDTEVVLYQGSGDTENGKTRNKVTLQENNWKYRELILTVERLGKEGTPYCIGASVTKEYDIPIRLNSVQGLNAKLRDRDSLVIDVEWIPSSETGVGGYEITVKGKDAVGKDISITIPVDGKDTGNMQIDLDEKDAGGTEIYKDLKGIDVLGFSIAAVPKDGVTDYMESRESDTYSLTIPPRLAMPNDLPKLMRGTEEVTADTGLPPEAFTEFFLQLEDGTASPEDAAYEVEYFVADKNAKAPGGPLADWNEETGNRQETDADGIYISAISRMNGNLRSAEYMLNQSEKGGFDAEQAGRMLWYRVRAVSNNKISSVWTKWTGAELPKALLEPVEIPESQTVDGKYSYTIERSDGTTGDSYEVSIRQPKAGFVPVKFAKGYKIYIQEATRKQWVYDSAAKEWKEEDVTPAARIYKLEEAEPAQDGSKPLRPFKLTEAVGGADKVWDDGIQEAATIENNMLQIETSDDETTYRYTLYTVTHSYKAVTGGTSVIYRIPVGANLCYRIKNNEIQEIWLELPEGVALTADAEEISDKQFIATSLADVTVIAPDAERYVVEKLTRWQRVKDGGEDYTDIKISKEDVGTAADSRIAVAGYYEDILFPDEMSDGQLKLFGLEREAVPEEEEEEESSVSGNEVTPENDAASENDTISGNDTEAENDTETDRAKQR